MQTPYLIDQDMISGKCPERPESGHKGTFGRVLICAGTPGMGGACCMAASSALRSGAGLVYVHTAEEILTPLLIHCPEALGLVYKELVNKAVPAAAAPAVATTAVMRLPVMPAANSYEKYFSEQIQGKDAVLIGPGIPPESEKLGIMIRIAAQLAPHLVLDAGALSYLALHEDVMQEVSARVSGGLAPAVLTPHAGEFARLAPGIPGGDLEKASAFAVEKGITLVLKSNETHIFTSDGKWYSNPVSNSGLAKGGSGDVLAGLLTGLLAQGMTEEDASICAVGIHSLAGKLCAAEHGTRAMLPTMLPGYYGKVFKTLGWEEGMQK